MLFYSYDRLKFGNESIFRIIIDELNFLYLQGIDIKHEGLKKILELTVIVGDNLGLHGIFVFNECFSSTHYCRFCISTKTEMSSQCSEDEKKC